MIKAYQNVNSYDKPNDIEMQNCSNSPVQNAADQKKVIDSIKRFLVNLIQATCLLGTAFSIIYTFYNFITLVHFDSDCLRIYLGDVTDIASLSPHTRQLHESHYEALFNDTNNNMVNFDEVPKLNGEWPYIESFNYYKNYSYILQHQNLSLFINLPYVSIFRDHEIHATLIDRSVTNKTVKELYSDYKHYDAKRIYQNLQHRQPVHRVIPIPDLSGSNASCEQTKMNHLWFLTDFVELFDPVFYHEGYRTNDTSISPENVNKLLARAADSDTALWITDFLLFFVFLVGFLVAVFLSFDTEGQETGAIIFLFISILHFVMAVVVLKRPGLLEMKQLVALLFESQNSNIEVPEVEQFNKIFTYHAVELIMSLIMSLIVLFQMCFVV